MHQINWKFVVAVAIIAMVVSLMGGGLGGIPFGILVVRALIAGMVFLVFAIGLNLLTGKYFPEILDIPGSRVDIVLPGEPLDSSDEQSVLDEDEHDTNGTSEEMERFDNFDPPPLDNLDRISGSYLEQEDDNGGSGASFSSRPDEDHDPEELAQAIHTVIKRDEKG